MRIDQQARSQSLRCRLDDHQVPAAAQLVPAACCVEHRGRVAAAEVVHQVRAAGGGDGVREQLAAVCGPGRWHARRGCQGSAQHHRRRGRDEPTELCDVAWHCVLSADTYEKTTIITVNTLSTFVTAASRFGYGRIALLANEFARSRTVQSLARMERPRNGHLRGMPTVSQNVRRRAPLDRVIDYLKDFSTAEATARWSSSVTTTRRSPPYTITVDASGAGAHRRIRFFVRASHRRTRFFAQALITPLGSSRRRSSPPRRRQPVDRVGGVIGDVHRAVGPDDCRDRPTPA